MSTDYYTHVLNTSRDPALRAAAQLALIRARLAQACGRDEVAVQFAAQDRRAQASPTQHPSRKQPRQ